MRHYENNVLIPAKAEELFSFVDNHNNLSSHMNKSSWMLGGGKMEIHIDEGGGQKVGSRITMSGKVLGINLSLNEVITIHEPPYRKEWRTVGNINLLVIDHYKLGFEITPGKNGSNLKVYINYDLPRSVKTRILGYLFGGAYAKWCVKQMTNSARQKYP